MVESVVAPVALWVKHVISTMGYGGVALTMAIESACVPLPSEIILPFSGSLVYDGVFNLHLASLSGALGCLIGSIAAYGIGFFRGRPLIDKYGRYVFLRRHELEIADQFFARHGDIAVFVSRLLPIVRTFISLPAGVAKMPFARFCLYSFVGSVPWCYILVLVGYKLGQNWERIRPLFRYADAAVAVLLVLWLAWLILRPKKNPENN